MPDQVTNIDTVVGTEVQMAFIGTCVNGRLEDLHTAVRVLDGQRVAPGVRLVIAPASRDIFLHALEDGTVAALTRAGATFLPSHLRGREAIAAWLSAWDR